MISGLRNKHATNVSYVLLAFTKFRMLLLVQKHDEIVSAMYSLSYLQNLLPKHTCALTIYMCFIA